MKYTEVQYVFNNTYISFFYFSVILSNKTQLVIVLVSVNNNNTSMEIKWYMNIVSISTMTLSEYLYKLCDINFNESSLWKMSLNNLFCLLALIDLI